VTSLLLETQYGVTPTSSARLGAAGIASDIEMGSTAVPPWLKRHVPTLEENAPQPAHHPRRTSDPITFPDIGKLQIPTYRLDFIYGGNTTVTFVEIKTPWLVEKKSKPQSLDPVWAIYYLASASTTAPTFNWPINSSTGLLQGYEAYNAPNWDGYDAEPITPQTLSAARAILRILPEGPFSDLVECSPGADGSIGFEWLMSDGPLRKLFIDIGPGSTWKAYWRLASGETVTIPRKKFSLTTQKELTDLFARLGA
jgi:hypothetical protein